MSKPKISISIHEELLGKLEAVMIHEKRPSVSNVIESTIDLGKYEFTEVTTKTDSRMKFIVKE